MKKRLLSFVLVVALVITALPFSAFAKTNGILYGDVDRDGEIGLCDILAMKLYLVEDSPADFSLANADVNIDNEIDLVDLLLLKKYLAEWDDIHFGPELVTVSFYDGENLIDSLVANTGYPLGEVPSAAKSSKANAVLEGYYTDSDFTTPFYAENPVTGNMSVYAKYAAITDSANLTPTSFAQMDVSPYITFKIKRISGDIDPANAAVLSSKDGSDPVNITVSDDNNSGIYTVKAPDGFNKGCSYELTLANGWIFDGKEESIRTAAFSIAKEAVSNIEFNKSSHYVKTDDPAALHAGSIVICDGVNEGDLVCLYKTVNPENRDYKSGNAYLDDPEIWFKASSVSGNAVTLGELESSDNEKMYDVPDNFPVIGNLPGDSGGTLTLATDSDGYVLDTNVYALMVGDENGNLDYAIGKVSIGDFISVYVSKDSIESPDDVYFGRITGYDSFTGVITFEKSSAEAIESAADMYIKPVVTGDDLISEDAKKEISQTVYSQIENSGFAEEAAYMLAEMAIKTDGFRSMPGVTVLFSDESGTSVSSRSIKNYNLGKTFELKDGVKLKVEIVTSGDQMHFTDKGAVQLAVGIDAQFETEIEDGGKVMINLNASFTQEIALGITASGELVKKTVLGFIPAPIGVKVGSSIDIKSFTGIRIDAQAYTEGEEDAGLMDQLEEIIKNPRQIGDLLPDSLGELKKGLYTAGDVINKIEELKGNLERAEEDVQKVKEYTEDIKLLWEVLSRVDDMPNEEEWNSLCESLCQTNISKDLMDMMELSAETELDADRYANGMSDLMTKYSEMLENETDWVKLVDKEMCKSEIRVYGLVIAFSANFIVRADINVAMGANLQYEVGKRYTFWIKLGLFEPSAGSDTIDLIDEQFAFQYYVMGKMGLKMGIKGAISFAIGSSDIASVGISLEFGPYVKIYGFFIYEYERTREANTSTFISASRMGGAVYMDFGLYLIVSLEAQAIGGMFEVSCDFIDEEYPLLKVGNSMFPYQFSYDSAINGSLQICDSDKDSSNGIQMSLPDLYRRMKCMNLTSGKNTFRIYSYDDYNITFSNPNFSIQRGNGNAKPLISVNVPEGTRYMECNMTVTYKCSKLAFTNYDMQITVPVYWTNLTEEEQTEYTANIRVGNENDGYETVWSLQVHKGEEFTLPTVEELKELIGYNEEKYDSLNFPQAGKTVSILEDTDYECTALYKTYELTVNGIQSADGGVSSKIFTAHYGEAFDFSTLEKTGMDIQSSDPNKAKFTKFVNVTTSAVIQIGTDNYGEAVFETIDLDEPISGKTAQAIAEGTVTANANYADDSVLVTYKFSGITADDHAERLRKGSTSTFDYNAVAAENGMAVKSISPDQTAVWSSVTYMVECGEIIGDKFTVSFEENGGNIVSDIERVGGSLIGTLPTPERKGYTFNGWFCDNELTMSFTSKLMPKEDVVLYAKWIPKTLTVVFDVNNGKEWAEPETGTRNVNYDGSYGEMPVPTRSGYGFIGWFTDKEGGSEVKSADKVTVEQNITLYAHWRMLVTIDSTDVFTYEPIEETYTGSEFAPVYDNIPTGTAERPLTVNDFTFKYKKQGDDGYITGKPVNVGTYDVVICREADNYYNAFEISAVGVVKINKAVFVISEDLEKDDFTFEQTKFCEVLLTMNESGYAKLPADRENLIITYKLQYGVSNNQIYDAAEIGTPFRVQPFNNSDWKQSFYKLSVEISSSNYDFKKSTSKFNFTQLSFSYSFHIKKYAPNVGSGSMEEFTVENNAFTITTPGQMLYLQQMVYEGNKAYNSSDITYTLGNDIDMSEVYWNSTIGSSSYGEQGFRANFDGNGHVISGLYAKGSKILALFDRVSGTIKNLRVEDSFFYGEKCGGIVANLSGGTIENCSVDIILVGKKISTDYAKKIEVGGIAASMNSDGKIINCTSSGIFSSITDSKTTSIVGGIVGSAEGAAVGSDTETTVSGCTNEGKISGTYAGGIIGYQKGVINIENNNYSQGIPATEIGGSDS